MIGIWLFGIAGVILSVLGGIAMYKLCRIMTEYEEWKRQKLKEIRNKQEFDPTYRIIDCDSYGCDQYKFNGQAICFQGECPYVDR